MSIFFQCWRAHFSSWDNFVLFDQKRTALQNCFSWYWAFKMLTGIPQLTCQTTYCSEFLWKSQPGEPHLSIGPYLSSGLFLWDRIHSSNSYLASSVQLIEWEEFCLSNQVCSLHFVSWLCKTNTDIGILQDLKIVAEKAKNEKE